MDKLADGLQRLGEDDLLQVVQMVHDNKAPDSYTKNDVERKYTQTNQAKSEEPFFNLLLQRENFTSTCIPSQTV
jgi:transcription initiation factor IIF auxiliary subunit